MAPVGNGVWRRTSSTRQTGTRERHRGVGEGHHPQDRREQERDTEGWETDREKGMEDGGWRKKRTSEEDRGSDEEQASDCL